VSDDLSPLGTALSAVGDATGNPLAAVAGNAVSNATQTIASAQNVLGVVKTIFSGNGVLIAIGVVLAIGALLISQRQTIVTVAQTAAKVGALAA
jgi:hypothetical protein